MTEDNEIKAAKSKQENGNATSSLKMNWQNWKSLRSMGLSHSK